MLEGLATAIAAGALLASFVIGAVGFLAGWSRESLERRVLTDGYLGGMCGAVVVTVDLVVRYG